MHRCVVNTVLVFLKSKDCVLCEGGAECFVEFLRTWVFKGLIRNYVTVRATWSLLPVGSCKRSRNNCAHNLILEALIHVIKRRWG